ncbi:hypothetical protein C7M84_010922 [Penaeus vannamei]|uniref:Uncharacterized protein n=1 Tax=Penaeus vannamei TaxID=6689 RepID=A0A423T2R7_PENVA|nr:hypothetical protein C7M84_010922 [Penaeus vannamei]
MHPPPFLFSSPLSISLFSRNQLSSPLALSGSCSAPVFPSYPSSPPCLRSSSSPSSFLPLLLPLFLQSLLSSSLRSLPSSSLFLLPPLFSSYPLLAPPLPLPLPLFLLTFSQPTLSSILLSLYLMCTVLSPPFLLSLCPPLLSLLCASSPPFLAPRRPTLPSFLPLCPFSHRHDLAFYHTRLPLLGTTLSLSLPLSSFIAPVSCISLITPLTPFLLASSSVSPLPSPHRWNYAHPSPSHTLLLLSFVFLPRNLLPSLSAGLSFHIPFSYFLLLLPPHLMPLPLDLPACSPKLFTPSHPFPSLDTSPYFSTLSSYTILHSSISCTFSLVPSSHLTCFLFSPLQYFPPSFPFLSPLRVLLSSSLFLYSPLSCRTPLLFTCPPNSCSSPLLHAPSALLLSSLLDDSRSLLFLACFPLRLAFTLLYLYRDTVPLKRYFSRLSYFQTFNLLVPLLSHPHRHQRSSSLSSSLT